MYEVLIEGIDDCNCYKKRGEELPQTFESSNEAKSKAEDLIDKMNDSFCGVHQFSLRIYANRYTIVSKRVI